MGGHQTSLTSWPGKPDSSLLSITQAITKRDSALMVGHLLECSNLVTGGYYSGFKDLLSKRNHLNLGYPIAEVNSKGEAMIYKEKNTGGCVTVGTVVSQLLYEIQGPLYYNSDVTADITNVLIEQVSEDVVSISGVKGLPPPPTTKVGITAPAGWQAEFHLFLVGLDVKEKARWTEEQVRDAIGDDIHRFSLLKFHVNGTSPIDAENQDVATVDFRIFAQSSDPEVMRTDNPEGLNRWILGTLLQCAPVSPLPTLQACPSLIQDVGGVYLKRSSPD